MRAAGWPREPQTSRALSAKEIVTLSAKEIVTLSAKEIVTLSAKEIVTLSAKQIATVSAKQVVIHADGACRGNPGPGGWGAILSTGDHEKEIFGGERHTTNNRMEVTAVIRALESLKVRCDINVYTDSQYVQKGISEWMPSWKRRGWRTAGKKPVKNVDLWQRLDALASGHSVRWHWVKGHAGHDGNERADVLANRGVDSLGA